MYLLSVLFFACSDSKSTLDPIEGDVLEDKDADGYLENEDCDDNDAAIHPDAPELCDGLDNNCNNQADEEVTITFYADSDADGFGSSGITVQACEQPEGFVDNGTDCDDTDDEAYPGAEELCDDIDNDCNSEIDDGLGVDFYADEDSDGYGDDENIVEACALRDGLSSIGGDCDDSNAALSPGAEELCDGIDNNCNSELDEGVQHIFYRDFDEDSFGDPQETVESCEFVEGYVDNSEDCDDLDTLIHPLAPELCDEKDNNCDGNINEDGAIDAPTWYADTDGDGYGVADIVAQSCSQPFAHVSNEDDCDDDDDDVHPTAVELCNGLDDNCNGELDEGVTSDGQPWYADVDGDGFGDPENTILGCFAPDGFVGSDEDCDDSNSLINPDAEELCNGVDDDCVDGIDAGAVDAIVQYLDDDGDGFGADSTMETACELIENAALLGGDCDDESPQINPVALELCDEVDNDCDEEIDEGSAFDAERWYLDGDGDGFGAAELDSMSCAQPENHVADGTDCDDSNDLLGSTSTDGDCDGVLVDQDCDDSDALTVNDMDCDGVTSDEDCDDLQASVYDGAPEVCDLLDNDCDGEIDNDAVDAVLFYADSDGDGFGSDTTMVEACAAEEGAVTVGGDCDDLDVTSTHAGIDADCDGVFDVVDCAPDDPLSTQGYWGACEGSSVGFYVETDYISVPNSAGQLALTGGDFTVEAWVRPQAYGDQTRVILSNRDQSAPGFELHVASEELMFMVTDYDLMSGVGPDAAQSWSVSVEAPELGLWTHVAVVRSADVLTLYLNGAEMDSAAVSDMSNIAGGDLTIGNRNTLTSGVGPQAWRGEIGAVHIAAEAVYSSEFCPDAALTNSAATVGLWSMEEGEGAVAAEQAGVLNAELVGPVWSPEQACLSDAPVEPEEPVSDDCEGYDTGFVPTWYADLDGDGEGDSDDVYEGCVRPEGYVETALDQCPEDGTKTEPGICGCDGSEEDVAGYDGVVDCIEPTCTEVIQQGVWAGTGVMSNHSSAPPHVTREECLTVAFLAGATIVNYSPDGFYPTCYYGHPEMMDRWCSGSACGCSTGTCWANVSHYECTYGDE